MATRWRILAVLFLARTAMAFQFQAVAALSPVMMHEFGVGLAEIGVLIGLYLAPGIVIAWPGGAIGRWLGDGRAVTGGMVLMIGGGLLMAFGTTWETQLAGRLIAGTGGVVLNVLMSKTVQDWFVGREIATAMAIFVNSWPVGIAAALLALPPIAAGGGYVAATACAASLIALGLALFLTAYRPPETAGAPPMSGGRLAGGALACVLLAGGIWALFNAAFVAVFGFGPAMLAERGWSLAEASSATSLALWISAIAAPLGGFLADRSGRPDILLSGGLVLSAAALALAASTDEAILFSFAVIGLAAGLAAGPILRLPAEVLAPETRAPGMGLFYTLYYAVALVFPAVAGRLAETAGSASATFLLGSALLLACLPLLGAFRLARRIAGAGAALERQSRCSSL